MINTCLERKENNHDYGINCGKTKWDLWTELYHEQRPTALEIWMEESQQQGGHSVSSFSGPFAGEDDWDG
ncbi:unnamed protein product, partial [Vitis vinifera]